MQVFFIYIYSLMVRETWVQSQVESLPKTLKMVIDTSLPNTRQYKVRTEGKVDQSGKGVAPSPTLRCCRYWKGSLLVALDYCRQLYLLYIYIYIYVCVCVCVCVWCHIVEQTGPSSLSIAIGLREGKILNSKPKECPSGEFLTHWSTIFFCYQLIPKVSSPL